MGLRIEILSTKIGLSFEFIPKMLVFLILLIKISHQKNYYEFTTAIQQTNETYMSYMPLIQNCNYSASTSNISTWSITTEVATPQNLFDYYHNAQKLAFWSSIQNGLDIYLVESQLLVGYDGIIMKPQIFNSDQNNLSDNSTNDIVTLFKTQPNGTLVIYFVEVYVEQASNYSISTVVQQTLTLNLTTQTQTLIQNCQNNNLTIVISQLDANNYIGLCRDTTQVFFFTLGTNLTGTVFNFTDYDILMPINNMILNPVLEVFGTDEVGWNVFLLTNGSQQAYSCYFDPVNPSNFSYLNQTQFSEEFQELIQKLWDEESNLLQIKLEKLLSHIGPNATEKFPGKITSIFIDQQDNVYVESVFNDTLTFLNVYDWQKFHILNISFSGRVLLYNHLKFLISGNTNQTNDLYTIMTVNVPMVSFNINQVVNNSYTAFVPCNDGYNNLTIKYNLFLSNINYPTAYTYEMLSPNLFSSLSIFTFQLKLYYAVFGPGYTVYFEGPDQIQATLLDASIISMGVYILSIVEIIVSESTANSIFKSSDVVYTTDNEVYRYSSPNNQHMRLGAEPCGIKYSLKGMKLNADSTLYYGYQQKYKDQLLYCLCPSNTVKFSKCQIADKRRIRQKVMKSVEPVSKKLQKLNSLSLYEGQSGVSDFGSQITMRLFTIADQQLMVTVFNNNTAVLSTFPQQKYLDSASVQCKYQGEAKGVIFVKAFYDPSLILFCLNGRYLNQYKIRYNKFWFNRVIPLYGFQTRFAQNVVLVGTNYIFIEVFLDRTHYVNSTINVNPQNNQCCVLRIDPLVDTVSAIKEVIFALNIQQVYQYSGIDVAYYQGSQVTSDDSFLKVYLDETWLALNQTSAEDVLQTYNFQIVFASINYNFASEFSVNITYNMTQMGFNQISEPFSSIIYLEGVYSSTLPQIFTNTISFNYSGIQGPILEATIQSSDTPEMIEDVELNEIIVQRKILGNVGATYLQIFTPMRGQSNTTFDNSIIVVGSTQLRVYLKNFNDQQMFNVGVVNLTNQNCQYFPYKIFNSTTIQFVSQCMVPEFNLSIPILTMNLTIYNSTYATLHATQVQGSVTVRLSDLKTLVFDNITLVLGIDEGPMQSLTGKLQYCSSENFCSVLYNSSKQYFLLDYDVFIYGQNSFIVTTLDFQFIELFINPQVPSQSYASISPNFTINLDQYIAEDISIITLVSGNSSSFTAILSGTQAYYEVIYVFNGSLTILTIFQRYANCQLFDRFSVSYLLDENNRIEALITECNQNQNILRLQTYERINSSSVVIYTGYLQYFTRYGPVSYLATDSTPAFNPIRILQLSNTMINKLFMLYKNEKQQIKLVYQQIDGILADNYVTLSPSLQITLSPLTTNLNFPTLTFSVENDFNSLTYVIFTKPAPLHSLTKAQFVCLIIFAICNVLHIIGLVLFAIYRRKKEGKNVVERQSIAAKSWQADDEQHTLNSFKDFRDKIRNRFSGLTRKGTRNQTDVRKQTEIQLFTRRSQSSKDSNRLLLSQSN